MRIKPGPLWRFCEFSTRTWRPPRDVPSSSAPHIPTLWPCSPRLPGLCPWGDACHGLGGSRWLWSHVCCWGRFLPGPEARPARGFSVPRPGNPQQQRPCVHIQTVMVESLGRCHNTTSPSFHFLVWNWILSLALARITWGHDEMSLTRPGTRASWKGQVASRTEKEAHTPQA